MDDTVYPKKGHHSVGVVGQCCGVLGKRYSCQVAMSVSLVSATMSVPAAYRLYPVESWAKEPPPKRYRLSPDHPPLGVGALARELPRVFWHSIRWRQGTRGGTQSRFAAVRVRVAHRDKRAARWSLYDAAVLVVPINTRAHASEQEVVERFILAGARMHSR